METRSLARRWVRTERVDEDMEAGEDAFNASCKVAPTYQDVFGLMEEGDDREVRKECK